MPLARVLVVDDEPTYRASVSRCLTNQSYHVTAAESGEKALELLSSGRFDLVISDIKMPGMSGVELLGKVSEISPGTASIIMTAFATIETAIEATKLGAFHYLIKPFNVDELVQLAARAIEHKKLKEENTYLKKHFNRNSGVSNVVGKSKETQNLVELINKTAATDSCALITGENGTGKSLVAKTIHSTSIRMKKLFAVVDCSSGNSESLEIELFGYVKGSFPGAVSSKAGVLEIAEGGTVLLDNIQDIPQSIQTKIINFVSSGTYCPIGTSRAVSSDVRIVASSSKNIVSLNSENKIKKDLLNRLSVIPIELSPLRDRPEDIETLVNHFLNLYGAKRGKGLVELEDGVMNIFTSYSWPGNTSELKNLLERLVTLSNGTIRESDIPRKYIDGSGAVVEPTTLNFVSSPKMLVTEDGVDLNNIIKNIEDDLIKQALDMTSWNKNRAAKLLGLNRTTLVEKLRKRGLINSRIKD